MRCKICDWAPNSPRSIFQDSLPGKTGGSLKSVYNPETGTYDQKCCRSVNYDSDIDDYLEFTYEDDKLPL